MAEFTGFSAVGDLFGDDDPVEEKTTPRKVVVGGQGGKRLGVGSVAAPLSSERSKLTHRVLKVGRKRNRLDGSDDDDEGDGTTHHHNDNFDDEEEDVGRTAIVQEESKKQKATGIFHSEDAISNSQITKKKLGKKERLRLKEDSSPRTAQDIPSSDLDPVDDAHPDLRDEGDAPVEDKIKVDGLVDSEETASKKRKRRKIRSKQKNVRKDNREKKPRHLLPGYNYQGRPLTEETRKRLGLPDPKTTRHVSTIPSPPPVKDGSIKLGVEDLLDVKKPESSKKKRKSKYKNLK
jgi:hypothetical protein